MQHGGGGTPSQYGEMTSAAATASHMAQQQQPVEPASPIRSLPPETSVTSNLDELMRPSGGGEEDEGDRAGSVAGGNRWPRQETLALLKIRSDMDSAFRDSTLKGPLWEDVSRKIAELGFKRSARKCKEKFENVHKYYKRTKEGRAGRQDGKSYKFFSQLEALHSSSTVTATASNVPAYLPMPVTTVTASNTNTNTISLDVAPVSIGIPMPISSVRIPTSHSPTTIAMSSSLFPPDLSAKIPAAAAGNVPGSATTPAPLTAKTTTTNTPVGISFSSNSSSSSPETEDDDDDDDDDDDMDFEGQPSNTNTVSSSRKRKRQSSSSTHQMMQFFEGLMEQVMQKQEAMRQMFLEVIEKREQDRMIREEAWKRQEMARLAREHELMAQERAISASRDAAIISFLQKITGQKVQLPPAVTIPTAPPPAAPSQVPPVVVAPTVSVPVSTPTQANLPPSLLPPERQDQQKQHQQQTQTNHRQVQSSADAVRHQPASTSIPSEVVMAIPEKQVPPKTQEIGSGGSIEPSSSRWPKVEVLALIKLRSGLEPRYQDAGPKGPLWEEISAGMQRMGFNRSAKRCKEKWENINKYFKKVKEGNKKRPEDAKTCPYFHELDVLYRKKILGGTSTSTFSSQNITEEPQHQQHQQDPIPAANPQDSSNVSATTPTPQLTQASEPENKNNAGNVDTQASNVGLPGSLFGEGNGAASQKPEDIVKELIIQQGTQQQHQPAQTSIVYDFDKISDTNMGSESDNMDQEEDYEEDEEDDDEQLEEDKKMAYKVEFQRQKANASNGGGNEAPSFLAMVQ